MNESKTAGSCCTKTGACTSKLKCTPCMMIFAVMAIIVALKFFNVF